MLVLFEFFIFIKLVRDIMERVVLRFSEWYAEYCDRLNRVRLRIYKTMVYAEKARQKTATPIISRRQHPYIKIPYVKGPRKPGKEYYMKWAKEILEVI